MSPKIDGVTHISLLLLVWDHRTSPPPLIGIRDPLYHAERRQNWARGFTSAAIKQYEVILISRCRQLVECLEDHIRAAGEMATATVDAGAWMSYFTYALFSRASSIPGLTDLHYGQD